MKIDISRDSYQRFKHYTRVLMQQGRVQLDADWNEQIDILWHHLRTLAIDLAGPRWAAGVSFRVAFGMKKEDTLPVTVAAGDYFVGGIPCEFRVEPPPDSPEVTQTKPSPFDPPPVVPFGSIKGGVLTWKDQATPLDFSKSGVLIYLEMREELVTSLDDDAIREVALGGPDTAARTQVVFQLVAGQAPTKVNRDTALYYKVAYPAVEMLLRTKPPPAWGRLAAHTSSGGPAGPSSPCVIPADSRYRGLENQLYRVEIHRSGASPKAGPKPTQGATTNEEPTFVWSRDNGSVVTRWKATQGNTVEVGGVGREGVTGFAENQWVELTHGTTDSEEAAQVGGNPTNPPVNLFRIARVDGNFLTLQTTVTLEGQQQTLTLPPHPDDALHPKVRRWDSPGEVPVEVPATNDGWIALEDGIEVKFEAGKYYRRGDYWLIPARTNTGDILWPRKDGKPQFQYARHPFAHRAPLAFLSQKDQGIGPTIDDLRVSVPRPFQVGPPAFPTLPSGATVVVVPGTPTLLFRLFALGTQGYDFDANRSPSWQERAPQATLLDEQGTIVGRLFFSPGTQDATKDRLVWQADDGSEVRVPFTPLGTFDSPAGKDVAWARYKVADGEPVPKFGLFKDVQIIQRLFTVSEDIPSAPPTGNEPKTQTVKFLATYYFYKP